jgi:hypothetical protein
MFRTMPILAVSARGFVDVRPVFVDQLFDVPRGLSGIHAGVGDRAAEAHVVPKVVDPAGVLEELLDVGLADAKATVNVASVVSFLVIAHVLTPC